MRRYTLIKTETWKEWKVKEHLTIDVLALIFVVEVTVYLKYSASIDNTVIPEVTATIPALPFLEGKALHTSAIWWTGKEKLEDTLDCGDTIDNAIKDLQNKMLQILAYFK